MLEKYKINVKYLGMLAFIQANVKNKNNEYIGEIIKTSIFDTKTNEYLESLGLIEYNKTGGKEPWWRVRLSKKGKEVFDTIYGSNKLTHPNAESFAQCLNDLYNQFDISDKFKDMNKTIDNISHWLKYKDENGIDYTLDMFKAVVEVYLESFEYEKRMYIKESANLFFTPDTRYSKNWTPSQCPLEGFLNIKGNKTKIAKKLR